jgi:serine protease
MTVAPLDPARKKPNGHSKFRDLMTDPKQALKALTLDAIKQLRENPDVEYAEPNFIRRISVVPNDTHYPRQWHYPLISLPQAWDVTTGTDNVIVAVLDTGALLNHPDLGPRLIPGYDFISDPVMAGDGGGIDPDTTDVGDDPDKQSSSFHGTHVAGTIGAATNNGTGVAGVTWQSKIMPLRVLGIGGGTDADITQAIRYAAGLTNSSNTLPAQRAHVINMSLGGGSFSQTLQSAITAARTQGVIVVAAAGNENSSQLSYPASYDGVISVAAVDMVSERAPYSNFGRSVDVAAPGGNTAVDLNGDQFQDGVLSTIGNDKGEMTFVFYQGTSMATPHVAGVIALMLAVNPNLTPTDIDQLISGTHASSARRITIDRGTPGRDDFFGHGLLNAFQAVTAAKEVPGGTGPLPTGSVLSVSASVLYFDNFLNAIPVTITNAGSGTLNVTSIASNTSWLTIENAAGGAPPAGVALLAGVAPLTTVLRVNRAGLPDGVHAATLTIVSDATVGSATTTISVKIRVGGPTSGNVGTVIVLALDETTLKTVSEGQTTSAQGYTFSTAGIPPGRYFLIAGTDRDNDDFICDIEDACGFFPTPVTMIADQVISGITFVVGELNSPQNANEAAKHLRGKTFRRRPHE